MIYSAYSRRKEKIETKNELEEELDELHNFILKNYESSEVKEKQYIRLFRKAKNLVESEEFDSARETIKEARKLKKRENRIKKQLDGVDKKIELKNLESSLQRKYRKIGEIIEDEKYDEAEKLLAELYSSKGHKKFEGKWLKPGRIEEIKSARIGLDNNFRDYSPYEFEKFIAKLFQKIGYETETTRKSADYGIDVIAKKTGKTIGIQVKQYNEENPVGTKEVQNTLGSKYAADADHTILVTTSYFTEYAKKQAKNAPIELWDRKKLHEMVKEYFINLDENKIEK